MNPATDLATFAGIMVLAQFSPGPDMILMTRVALREGARQGVETALGIASGLIVHAALAVAGAALLLGRWPAVRWAGAAYLMWLGVSILRERFIARYARGKPGSSSPIPRGRPFLRGLLCNLLNPKAALFLAAVSAPFLAGPRPGWWPAALSAVVVVQSGVLWSLWAGLLQWPPLRSRYESAATWLDAAFALTLIAVAVRLAIG